GCRPRSSVRNSDQPNNERQDGEPKSKEPSTHDTPPSLANPRGSRTWREPIRKRRRGIPGHPTSRRTVAPAGSVAPVALPLEDYAMIGDTHTAALVGRNGSIDWLCLPRFDSGACFAALLGNEEHGCWRIAPAEEVVATRRKYRDGTLVLETEFETDEGAVRIIDSMLLSDE